MLLSDTVDTGTYTPPMTVQLRESGGNWTQPAAISPVMWLTLSDTAGDKTVEARFTDSLANTFTVSKTITLVEEADPHYPWDPATQRIANNLPQWHPGRRLRSSNWQRFMNLVGLGLGKIAKKLQDTADSLFLSICPTNEIDLVGRVWPDPYKITQAKDSRNLLINPTFSLQHQIFSNPDGWALSSTDEWHYDETQTLFGRKSLRTAPGVGESSALVQEIDIELGVGETLTGSAYYRTTNSPVPTAVPASVDFALQVIALYEDGTSARASVTLDPETDSGWYDATVTLTATANVVKAWLVVNVDHITALGAFDIWFSGAQLERGNKATPLHLGPSYPHWMVHGADVNLEPSSDLWLTTSRAEFYEEAIPTRVGDASAPDAGVFVADSTATRAYTIEDALKQSFDLGYLATAGQIGLYETLSQSLINTYNVAFYVAGAGGFVEVEDFEIEAVTFFNDMLWAIGYFNDQAAADLVRSVDEVGDLGSPVDGTDRVRFLCVLEWRTPAEQTSYLEVIHALPLIVLDIADPIVSMGFDNEDLQWLYYRTATEEYYSRLHYDYGLVRDDGSVWLREPDTYVSLS